MEQYTVYLAGGIFGLTDSEANTWREEAITKLNQFGIVALNPMIRDYRGKEDEHMQEIVEKDKHDIISSDVVLVNATKPSWGTAMEIMFAYQHDIPIIAFVDSEPFSPWIRYHCVVHLSFAEAIRDTIFFLTGIDVPNEKK